MPDPIPLANYHCKVGEGPLYHPERDELLWTDIEMGRLFSLTLATGEHRQIYTGPPVGGMTLQPDGRVLLFRVNDIAILDLATNGVRSILPFVDAGSRRFNDVTADPAGRVYCGTIGTDDTQAGLFRLDPDHTMTCLFRGTGVANGMAFTADRKTFYWTDTTHKTIFAFDYDEAPGALSNRRPFYVASDDEGAPDGLTIDTDGNIFSARWGGSRIRKHAALTGNVVEDFRFAPNAVSSCTFGGKSYSTLFVTTAGGDGVLPAAQPTTAPHVIDTQHSNGTLYLISGLGTGLPTLRSRIEIV